MTKVAIVLGSLAPVPPVRPIGPALVIFYTVEHLSLDNIRVFAPWEPALDSMEYDRSKYHAVKPSMIFNTLLRAFHALPYYRVYKPLVSRWFQPHDPSFVAYALTVAREVQRYHPDVIVSHVNYSLVFWLRRFCPWATLLYYHHGSNMHLRLTEPHWRKFEKVVDGIISVSQATFDGLVERFGPIHVPTWVIHNGVDTKLFHPMPEDTRVEVRRHIGVEEDAFVFMYVGRIVRSKGVDLLLDAFASLLLRYPFIRLVIVGSSKLEHAPEPQFEEELWERARNMNGRVHFVGGVENRDIPMFLSAADVVVLPTIADEGVPLCILEAMACQKAVIATDKGGIPEILQHEHSGLLLPANHVEDLLPRAMEKLILDTSLRQRCARNALQFIEQNCTYAHVACKFDQVLRDAKMRSRHNGGD